MKEKPQEDKSDEKNLTSTKLVEGREDNKVPKVSREIGWLVPQK